MKLVLLTLLFVVAFAAAPGRFKAGNRDPNEVRFQQWMGKHGKQYASQVEYKQRLTNYIATTGRIQKLNMRARELNSTATYAINKFADLTQEEFSVRLGMKGYIPTIVPGATVADKAPQAPTSWDWRKHGGITAVKDQKQCGSCWAFSCTESIESVYMIKGGKKNQVPLAPQQIVDCDRTDDGCNGGNLVNCFKYVQTAGGLEPESDYPYRARDEACKAKRNLEQDPVTGFQYVIPHGSKDEKAMADFVAANSPVSIAVDAESWSSYSGGIMKAAECGHTLDHAVQIVGYDTTAGYWIVRNSWGPDWGEQGFIRLQFGHNTCGLASEVTVPKI